MLFRSIVLAAFALVAATPGARAQHGRQPAESMARTTSGTTTAARSDEQPDPKTLPLWEAGAGLAAIWLPDYRGSDEARGYLLPFPWFVFRGEILKADREGLRAQFLDTRYFELDLSFGATVPVRSEKNRARRGMPSLKPTGEIGPVMQVHLYRSDYGDDPDFAVDLRIPVRRALTWDNGGVRDVGTLAYPHVNVDRRITMLDNRWNLGVAVGAYYGDRRYHQYFYGVAPEFATAERPAYQPGGGYGGVQALVGLSTRYGPWWVGGFLRFDRLRGAAFEDSPLVRRRHHVAGGVGVAWIFAESERRVPR